MPRQLRAVRAAIVLGTCLVATAAATLSIAAANTRELEWQFGVLLDDKRIGYHNFNVSYDGNQRVLETEAKFDVKVLFLTAFRYRHSNTEIWNDGCLASIDASTNNNGDQLEVIGRRDGGAFALRSHNGESELPKCVQSFAYWNPAILESERLLNSQTGEYEDVSVNFEGEDEVSVGGKSVDALRYRLSAKRGDITLWYATDDRRWLALEAPAKGGRTIRYEPLAVPEPQVFEELVATKTG